MTTITNKKQYPSEQYLNELITNMEFAARAPVEVVRAMAAELQERRKADSRKRRLDAAEKRIAELENSETQLINERDHAESALADMYFAATGDRPEWSNCFSFSDAVDAVVDRIADLEAKQPAPVVPEECPEEIRDLMASHSDALFNDDDVQEIWNACRATMLQANQRDLSQPVDPQVADYEKTMLQAGNSPVTPDGWARVPVKPTREMLRVIHPLTEAICTNCGHNVVADCEDNVLMSWVDMIDAAPKPETTNG